MRLPHARAAPSLQNARLPKRKSAGVAAAQRIWSLKAAYFDQAALNLRSIKGARGARACASPDRIPLEPAGEKAGPEGLTCTENPHFSHVKWRFAPPEKRSGRLAGPHAVDRRSSAAPPRAPRLELIASPAVALPCVVAARNPVWAATVPARVLVVPGVRGSILASLSEERADSGRQ